MTSPRNVLVVDGTPETATVLQAVLEPRGASVHRTRLQQLHRGWEGSGDPHVVVVDVDGRESGDEATPLWCSAPHVVISSERILVEDGNTRFLQKPFQFPELIRAIEDLLPASRNELR